jgi:hypothetical protein
MTPPLRIGAGAGFTDDRIAPALAMAEAGAVDYLVFECLAEGQVGYAGIGAVERARLAAEVVQERLRRRGFAYEEMRVDLIGCTSLHGAASGPSQPYEVRLRIAARTPDRRAAAAVGYEVRAMHVNGPTGGGGGSVPVVRDVMAVQSVMLPRALVPTQVTEYGGVA